MSRKNEWTPYGLEAIRIAHLRRRRLFGIAAIVGFTLLLFLVSEPEVETEIDISVNGNRGNGISLDLPEDEAPKNGPVTVSLSPGRVTRAEAGAGASTESSVQRNAAPTFARAPAYDFSGLILFIAPWALIAAAGWLLAKKRGKHDEVNYGVYKGAMPLEMITASASRQVLTRRHARVSLFGRRRADHLPAEVTGSAPAAEEP